MNIYFSCSITGGREDQDIYAQIVHFLQEYEYKVLTAHLAYKKVIAEEADLTPIEVYRRDMTWVSNCDVLIAEVSTPSHGVGYEIAEAIHYNKPVFCCYKKGRKVSKIITGNTNEKYRVFCYKSTKALFYEINDFLEEFGEAR